MSLRTPLSRVRGLGASRGGTEHFWRQRLTAVANIPLLAFFVIFVIAYNGADYETLTGALGNPIVAAIMGLVIISGLIHMRIGMQVIVEDYIHEEFAKLAILMLNTFFTLIIGALCLFAVIKLGFGG
ncbi:succinate dehydrogenase, hydrophobic membrane anchor protein [Pararhizobium mangrovi]|uniref:Succinate dehydrogenase hydrophobic membrane anchor subunit n=1 Tax=Pararhizobium mangrovi TaxID=2590452 RepID=A0A506U0F7_9HYPH|nr:succinate dehydrogenase, hydrophobic membrane anchor protein [Pararhizobium mangrovi]TPW27046.1 succinate dehydrogenase, hydrophobic membrane anchor protein [Pararhizobium mangrovi]